ncbi:MAG: RNA polymerase sigma factor [Polyangiaceae bacterium]
MKPKREPMPRDGNRADDDLLAAVVAGDLGALGELYDRYARIVWHAAYRMVGNGADAEDIVHTVFMKLPEIAKSYDGRSSARAWLVGIAGYVSWRHRRGVGRFVRMLGSFTTTISKSHDVHPEREAAGKQEVRAFEAAMAALAPKKRIVFTLIEIEGLTSEEVARALSLPAATVRTRLHHARRELQRAMKEVGGNE